MFARSTSLAAARARLLGEGCESLSDRDLLLLLIGAERPRQVQAAEEILAEAGGAAGLGRVPCHVLMQPGRLGKTQALRLLAAAELGRRLLSPPPPAGRAITSPEEVAEFARARLSDLDRETIHALLLDGRNRPLLWLKVADGSWNACPADPKRLFSACLLHRSPAVILVHNHPSGDPTPSRDDVELTSRMVRAGALLGVRVLDHLVVGREGYRSLARENLLC
ncbi:MAG: JAB domain-containing protein [Myxococcales bacterium]|nr:JAB domain-containing protein [Myxococcales bacterium]